MDSLDSLDRVTPDRAVGLVLVRPGQQLGAEPFYQELIAGLEGVLGPRGVTLVLQVVASADDELATYARWAENGVVGAVVLVDLARADRRVDLLATLGLSAVVIGDPSTAGPFRAVWTDDADAMRAAVDALYGLGHRRIGRVTGPERLAHTQIRSDALRAEVAHRGIEVSEIASDYSEEGGIEATRQMLAARRPPTAIIYDNDLMALGGVRAAQEAGVPVPEYLSVLAWDDSALCQLADPPLAVMGHDVQGIGEMAAHALVTAESAGHRKAAQVVFVPRASVQSVTQPNRIFL